MPVPLAKASTRAPEPPDDEPGGYGYDKTPAPVAYGRGDLGADEETRDCGEADRVSCCIADPMEPLKLRRPLNPVIPGQPTVVLLEHALIPLVPPPKPRFHDCIVPEMTAAVFGRYGL